MQQHQSSLSNQNKRGKKRNAANLLSTDVEGDNIHNPRAAKRPRIKGKHDELIKDILLLPFEQINALPEPLKTRALALRAQNEASPAADNHRNSNSNTAENEHHAPPPAYDDQPSPHDDEDHDDDNVSNFLDHELDADDSGAETDDPDLDGLHFSMAADYPPRRHSYVAQPMLDVAAEEHGAAPSIFAAARPPPPALPAVHAPTLSSQPCPSLDGLLNERSRPYPYPYYDMDAAPQPNDRVELDSFVDDDQSAPNAAMNKLTTEHAEESEPYSQIRRRSMFSMFWWLLCACVVFLLFEPSLLGGSRVKYCDSHSPKIRTQNSSACEPCPFDAMHANDGYCMNGIAACRNRSDWFDPLHTQCKERDFVAFLGYRLRMMGNRSVELMGVARDAMQTFWSNEVSKWTTVKAWQTWWMELQTMPFEKLCKQHEMEIVLSYFILAWHLPMFRLMIVYLWSRMVLAILQQDMSESREEIHVLVIAVQLLSYVTPAVFVHNVWNKLFS